MTKTTRAALLLPVLLFPLLLLAQTNCTTPGQTPRSAFPVCGTTTFAQTTVPQCGGFRMAKQHCPGNNTLTDINPFYYKFTCYVSGTLGFIINPNDQREDYDWALFDVTNQDPNQIFANAALTISDNWSSEPGATGTRAQGTAQFVDCGEPNPTFNRMPVIEAGHNYLLLVSHFTPTDAGYSLSFGGGTAVITDNTLPRLKAVEASCGGDILRVKLNKGMKCSSVTASGSEFFITPSVATVVSATAIGCSTGFDTDSVELRLSTFLNPGNYSLGIRNGSDNNTILDICDRGIPETDKLDFVLLPRTFTPMDSLAPLSCAPRQLRLVFKRPMLCSSIAPDGSDFSITGTYPVSISGAACASSNGLSKEIVITLTAPLQQEGTFQLRLQQGSDGNPITDECGEPTPPGAVLTFSVLDTVNADFSYSIAYGCQRDTVSFAHPGGNRINSWQWDLDQGQTAATQNAVAYYTDFDVEKKVRLVVSNGFCSDTARTTIGLVNYRKAGFEVFEDQCPDEFIAITNTSVGRALRFWWTFGNGTSSNEQTPMPLYSAPPRATSYWIDLQITDSFNCTDAVRKRITVYNSCFVDVPNAFTPNNDGRNDRFHVLNAVKALNFEFAVYNRWGGLVFKSNNWKEGWDGKIGAIEQPTGVYAWLVRYVERDTGKSVFRKGTVLLIR
ncbi:gliding motility-associated C-terminal domain-containing protein [Flaviaesturariibacter flavus]|nr:gliding motility-associated C-terminal domain-containing protein [Flaviaesturariibacter flavus]